MKTIASLLIGIIIFIIVGTILIQVENIFGSLIAVAILFALGIWAQVKSEE